MRRELELCGVGEKFLTRESECCVVNDEKVNHSARDKRRGRGFSAVGVESKVRERRTDVLALNSRMLDGLRAFSSEAG